MIQSNISNDIEDSIKFLNSLFSNPNYYSVGVSMGGNRIIKYAGLMQEKCLFKAIVSIATPFDFNLVVKGLLSDGNDLCNFGLTNGEQNLV